LLRLHWVLCFGGFMFLMVDFRVVSKLGCLNFPVGVFSAFLNNGLCSSVAVSVFEFDAFRRPLPKM
jgi:hypothetical protein